MKKVKTNIDLILWQKSIEFVSSIYKVTAFFPTNETYAITTQIRRAVISIPSNIAEGAARHSRKEYIQFLYITLGSIAELDTQLLISKNLSYISSDVYDKLCTALTELSKMTSSLIRNLSTNP